MTEHQHSTPGPLARLRERRRARRQETLERRYFEHERACSSLDIDTANRSARATAYGTEGSAVLGGFDGGGGGG